MTRRPWTEQDIATLRRLYAETPTTELAEHFGRSLKIVYEKAKRLGLRKAPHYMREQHGARAREVGKATRFAPGQKPWNKGTHYVAGGRSVETRFSPGNTPYNWVPVGSYRINRDGYLDRKATRFAPGQKSWNKGTHYIPGGRAPATQFRPGNTPHNWVPVGSLRINRDGYLDRKVSDLRRGARDWEAVHRLVWKEAHGEIPAGHVVVFRGGRNSTVLEEITLDALELVTRQELMRRNSVHRYPEDVKAAIRQLGVLHRRINERTNSQ